MMTVAQLVRRFRQAVSFDLDPVCGSYEEAVAAETVTEWTEDVVNFLDEAVLDLAALVWQSSDRVALTLTANVGTYPLASGAFAGRVITPWTVEIDGRRLEDAAGSSYGLWTPDEFTRQYPNWANDAPGTVRRAVFRGDRLILHPAPSESGVAYVEGKTAPARLLPTDLAAVPELPERLHPGIAQLAVYKACKDMGQEASQFNRLMSMRDDAIAVALEIQRDNANAQMGSASTSYGQREERICV